MRRPRRYPNMRAAPGIRLAILICVSSACASRPPAVPAPTPAAGFRVVRDGADATFEDMVARARRAKVVFVGEQHDDPETHRAELALLEEIGRGRRPVIVSLEMIERDVQPVLDDYLHGRIEEEVFLARSRPWPRYATDYRPLVELAKRRGWPVVAANVPRPIASSVGRAGLAALDTLAASRRHAAREISCPRDSYHARFLQQMRSHSAGSGGAGQGDSLPTAVAERFYLAQCVKDETMAESIVAALRLAPRDALVVHFNGAFHSDYSQGVVDRVRRREPRWPVLTITAVPARDPASAELAAHRGRADFLLFTRRAN